MCSFWEHLCQAVSARAACRLLLTDHRSIIFVIATTLPIIIGMATIPIETPLEVNTTTTGTATIIFTMTMAIVITIKRITTDIIISCRTMGIFCRFTRPIFFSVFTM